MSKRDWISGALAGIVTGGALHQWKDKPAQLRRTYREKRETLYKQGKEQYEIVQASKRRIAVTAEKQAKERGKENETKEK
ncbi:hypothetical protein [Halobacillus salinus]|uniref:hypothetical protein n=1 Tax=Halobacillus salinus TaxID=192814 RepID=UPI0009A566DD|nr:hypothetical protein [Halobacillus salinus]